MTFDDGQSGNTPVHNVNTYKVQGSDRVFRSLPADASGARSRKPKAPSRSPALLDQNRSQIETDVLTAISGVEWALKEVETSARNVKLSRQEVDFTR